MKTQNTPADDFVTSGAVPTNGARPADLTPAPTRFSGHIWRMVGCAGALAAAFTLYVRSENKMDRANELRHRSLDLADELRHSSDDLTRMVRTYVITGDPIYKQHYQDILDIRDGKKPRPEAYGRIYWDLIFKDGEAPHPASKQSISLLELMRQAQFTEDEFLKLAEAKANSDQLTVPEFEAMKLVESVGPQREANRAKATNMLYDTHYHEAKAAIMKPIDEFDALVDARTLAAVRATAKRAAIFRYVCVAFGVGLVLTLWRLYAALSGILGGSVDEVYGHIAKIGGGNFSAPIRLKEGRENSVLAWLLETQAKLHGSDRERNRTEQALGESKRFAESIAQNSTNIIYVFDLDENRNVYTNRNAAETLGYTQAQILEMGDDLLSRIVQPEDLERVQKHYARFAQVRDNRIVDIEYRLRHANGATRWLWARDTVFNRRANGAAWQIMGTAQDITDRKRAEEELKEARQIAEAANRSKSEFLANMSHEIRTPMNGIIGMTELTLETELSRNQREYLDMVKTSALALLGLINDILDFSKIEADKMELESIDFSLRDCIGGLLRPLGLRADQKDLELVADIAADVPDYLIGDPMRLRQILINLTDNAIKFTEQGDVVVKIVNQVTTDGAPELHFSISDTGIGIPPEKQKAIFQAFAQADGSTTRHYGGTGLGLSIASQLIKKMRGRIWIESKVGEGTTFHFTARLDLSAKALPVPKHTNLRDLAGLRVLVVDDNAINRRMLHDVLVNWGMKPTAVDSGASAMDEMIKAANANAAYQLVLLDAIMPELDGFAVAKQIQEQRTLVSATVMMLSSTMFGGISARCDAVGIAAWLTKPITQSDLLNAILRAIGPDDNVQPDHPAPSQQQPLPPALRILVAEDNLINLAVITGILEKRGHSLVHADNGLEVLSALGTGSFDLVFMDVQMPEMDGFQATSRIRELETASGGHVPIIAMTAHAMAGDRERCLAAGMDDYISKPLRKEDLLRVLDRAAVNAVEKKRDSPIPEGRCLSTDAVLVDLNRLRDVTDNEPARIRRLVDIYLTQTAPMLDELGAAIQSNSSAEIVRLAHKLVGSSSSCGVQAFTRPLRELEQLGHGGDLSRASALLEEVRHKFPGVRTAFDNFLRTMPTPAAMVV